MTPQTEETFTAADVRGLFSKYRALFFTMTFFFLALGLAAAWMVPNKYKVHFVLVIDAKYFQSPLTHDFMPEVNDPSELKAESASLVSRALTPDFLDSLGNKYGIYQSHQGALKLPPFVDQALAWSKTLMQSRGLFQPGEKRPSDPAAPRQALLKKITILNVNDTTYDVAFAYVDPSVAYQAAQDIDSQIVRTLSEGRTANLTTLRDAIRKQLQWLSFNVAASSSSAEGPGQPQLIHEELAEVRSQISSLSARYTEQHPLLLELRAREKTLTRLLAASSNTSSARQSPVIGGESYEDVRVMSNDLLTKMNYLTIALESDKTHPGAYFSILESPIYPTAPSGPSKIIFALGGAVLGLCSALFVAAIREYFDRSTLHAEEFSRQLNLPLLGKLPVVTWKELKAGERN